MEPSKVYFTNMRTNSNINLPQKLKKLMKAAGIEQIDFADKFTAIKIHFGEPGNLAYLRPNYAKVVVDMVKELGGKPFLTDCNTLYVGGRKNALDHMDSAYVNGFNPFATGCHVIIADGLKGTDEAVVPVNLQYIKEAKVGRALMDADVLISLSHFKGHESTGFGGTMKNIGMGGGSRAGKMEQHSAGKPGVKLDKCVGCRQCAKICAHGAISFPEKKAVIDANKCVGCGRCVGICPKDAIHTMWDEALDVLSKKMVEYTYAICHGRPCFHISLVIDVAPCCDCHAENDAPVVPDVGMFASFDPVALDHACADAVMRQPLLPNTCLTDGHAHIHEEQEHDPFKMAHPDTNWMTQVEYGHEIGLGNKEYELITV